ncbi:restriction endonuclease [Mannheimia indoligenes]|uniref:restriction endonuclease n=1 Tax=Mannheimia indoligenes TaxID=3103145 RepID=UPI002FE51C7B
MIYTQSKQLLNPILNFLNSRQYKSIPEIITHLAELFKLDSEFLAKRYEVSNAKIFDNTTYWKLNDLEKSGLIEFIKKENKRYYIISKLGKNYINKSNDEILKFIRIEYLQKNKNTDSKASDDLTLTQSEENTPLELLDKSYKAILEQSYESILDTILSKTPSAFECIVTELLQKMGYGDGKVTQVSRDGGIDAIIKGDVLGFEQIYVQAKRYKRDTTIGRPEIQGFTGALLGLEGNATKGVFITTAKFSQEAELFANTFSKARIVLINGRQLAKYIYDYELGIQIEKQFSIKKLDDDYWNEIPDDN